MACCVNMIRKLVTADTGIIMNKFWIPGFINLRWLVVLVSLICVGLKAVAETQVPPIKTTPQRFWVEELVSGLNAPWGIAWLPDGDILITEKFGGLRRVHNGVLEAAPLSGGPEQVYQAAQSGLLDIVLDPEFDSNQRIYLAYTEGAANANRGAIFRARYTREGLVEGKTIFRVQPDSSIFPFPLAGRMQFLPDKTLLFTSTDDHARRHLAQRLDNHLAKILRIDRDGRAPADNPFIAQPGVLPEIYAYGTRAPLGIVRDPRNGTIWSVENGPRGGDELNRIEAGANYGWPITTYGIEYTGEPITDLREAQGIVSPVTYWSPSVAPSSVTLYLGDQFPDWSGDLLMGTLRGQHIRRIRIREGIAIEQEPLLLELNERIRDVRVGPDQLIYVLTDSRNGRLLRLRPGQPGEDEQSRVAKAPKVPEGLPLGGYPGPRPEPDVAQGARLFAQLCQACHSLAAGGAAGIGPGLQGVFGRKAGSADGYKYSSAMQNLDIVWTAKTIEYLLASPQNYVPGTTMTSAPMMAAIDRHNLIGYLTAATAPSSAVK